jgi:hypothetical protein
MRVPWGPERAALSNKNSIYGILIDYKISFVVLADTLPNHIFVTHNRMHIMKKKIRNAIFNDNGY